MTRAGVPAALAAVLGTAALALTVPPAASASPSAAGSGGAAARADFDGDGFADLAVGVPGEDVRSVPDAGAVNVLYGSSAGLTAAGDQIWTQDSAGVRGVAEGGDQFGSTLAAGDFDRDGHGDLAVGVGGESVGDGGTGAVQVLYGTPTGLTSAGDQLWHQDSPGVKGRAEFLDAFASSLAVGNFGRGAPADLAVGSPGEGLGDVFSGAGAVNVLHGSADGLTAAGDQLWHQDTPGVRGTVGIDRFGEALAAANVGKGPRADLAVGAPLEGVGEVSGAGTVHVLHGSATGLTAARDQLWSQDSPGVEGVADGDSWGSALAAADLGRSSPADLAVATRFDRAAVNVLYGSGDGLTAARDQLWSQDSPGVEGETGPFDEFGFALTTADLGHSGHADLAVSAPFDPVGTGSGVVNVLYGSDDGLVAAGDQLWSQDSPGVVDASETGDLFGTALAAADFGRGGKADLAVGDLAEDVGPESGAGAAHVLYGTATGLTAGGSQLWHQDSPGVEGVAESGVPDVDETPDRFGSSLAPRR